MPTSHMVTIEAHVLETETGIWCPSCSLPSAIRRTVALVWPTSLVVFARFEGTFCTDCGEAT